MKTGLFLLPSLAAVCYSAALPMARNGNVLKRDADDYTLTVTVTAAPPKTTVKSTANQGIYITVTKTLTTNPVVTVKKTTTSKKATTTKKVTTTKKATTTKKPTSTKKQTVITVYTTAKPKTTAKPITTSIDDNGDDSCDDNTDDCSDDTSTDDGSDDGSDTYGGFRKRQIFGLNPFTTTEYYTPDDPQPTSYGGDWGEESGWRAATTTTADDYDDDVVTTTVYTSYRHRHTTTAYAPRVTYWSKRQSDDEFDFSSIDTEIEEPEAAEVPGIETDNKKRNASPQSDDEFGFITVDSELEEQEVADVPDVEETDKKKRQVQFSVTTDLDYPVETFTAVSYVLPPVSTKAPSRTTDAGPYGPYGSWYPIATNRATNRVSATGYLSYPGYPVATNRPVATYSYPGYPVATNRPVATYSYPGYPVASTRRPVATYTYYSYSYAPVATQSPDVEDPDTEEPDTEDPNDDDKITNKRNAVPQITYEADQNSEDDSEIDVPDVEVLDVEEPDYTNYEVETDNKKRQVTYEGDDQSEEDIDTEVPVPEVETETETDNKKRNAAPQDDEDLAILSADTETEYFESEEVETETETDNKKRAPGPQITWWDFPSETDTPEFDDTLTLPFVTFDKRAMRTGDSACGQEAATVTVTSYVAKPTGLVHPEHEEHGMERSISRTFVQAGVSSLLLTSSSSLSTLTSSAQTTFATSTRARVELRD